MSEGPMGSTVRAGNDRIMIRATMHARDAKDLVFKHITSTIGIFLIITSCI